MTSISAPQISARKIQNNSIQLLNISTYSLNKNKMKCSNASCSCTLLHASVLIHKDHFVQSSAQLRVQHIFSSRLISTMWAKLTWMIKPVSHTSNISVYHCFVRTRRYPVHKRMFSAANENLKAFIHPRVCIVFLKWQKYSDQIHGHLKNMEFSNSHQLFKAVRVSRASNPPQ